MANLKSLKLTPNYNLQPFGGRLTLKDVWQGKWFFSLDARISRLSDGVWSC